MARSNEGWVSLGPLKGQNTSDNPLSLGEGWATDTLNIVLDPPSSMAVKRRGSEALSVPQGTHVLARHSPIGGIESDTELWAFTRQAGAATAWRKIGAAAFVNMPGYPLNMLAIRTLSFNGKLFIAGQNAINRLLVWDGSIFRYAGFAGPQLLPGPTWFGTGTYSTEPRYFKIDWIYIHNGKTEARSELSPVYGFVSIAGAAGARITRPAVHEYSTHWRLWASADNRIYFRQSGNLPIATTTFDDVVQHPSLYGGTAAAPNEVAPEIGLFLPPPNPYRLMTDGHRILMAGNGTGSPAYQPGETAPRTNRMWYTPVLGALDQGDDERIPHTSDQRNFLDIGDPPTGDILELGGPMEGQIFGFCKHRTWRMVPTGDLTTPYLTYPVTMVFGAGEYAHYIQAGAALGETEVGQPAMYFFDDVAGVYRVTANNDVQLVSADIQTEVIALRKRLRAGMALFSWPEAKQTWWYLPLTDPEENRIYVFHWEAGKVESQSVKGGWTKWIHVGSPYMFSMFLMHNRTPGLNTPEGRSLVPYGSPNDYLTPNAEATAYVFDRGAALDGTTAYSGSVTCAPLLPSAAHERLRVSPPTLVTTPHLMTRLTVSSIRDLGTEERSADIWLAPDGKEVAVIRTAEGLYQGDCSAIQIKIEDAVPNKELWQIFLATMPVAKQQPR